MKENWQEENLRKTKEVLTEHFERRKQEGMFKEMFREVNRSSYSMLNPPHRGRDIGWDTELSDFYDKLIWDYTPIEKKSIFNKIKNVFSSFYWNLRYKLWLINT